MNNRTRIEVARLTRHLDSLPDSIQWGGIGQKERFADPEIVEEARVELRRRSARLNFLNEAYFGEGCWAILLDLLVCRFDQIEVTVTSSCLASGLPTTTALRCITLLIQDGLILKAPNTKDKRSSTLLLSNEGYFSIANAIQAMREARDPTLRVGPKASS